jgi:hypothetical protein
LPPTIITKLLDEQQLQSLIAKVEDSAGRDSAFLASLLGAHCTLLGAPFGAVFQTDVNKPPRVVSVYPMPADGKARIEPGRLAVLRDCVNRCKQAGKVSFFRVGLGDQVFHAASQPLMRGGKVEGVSVVLLNGPSDSSQPGPAEDPTMPTRLAQAQTVAALYPGHVARRMLLRQLRQAQETRLALSVLAAAHQAEHFEACCMGVCNSLKTQLHASRVSVGWARDGQVKLVAMSDTENFDASQDLARRLMAAMEECYDQAQAVVAPSKHLAADDEALGQAVARCHHELLGHDPRPHAAVCSVPLRYRDRVVGALTIERDGAVAGDRFNGETASHLQAIADLIAPRLYDRDQDDKPIAVKVWRHTRAGLAVVAGPEHVGWKLIGLSLAALLAYACLASWDYRVDATFKLDAGERRVYSSSFAGFVQEVSVEVGQVVKKGDVLAKLDDTELSLQLADIEGKLSEATTRRVQSLATKDLGDAWRAAAVINQLQAQQALLKFQVARASLVAAEDGVVLKGDWKQKLGVRVDLGTPLFEVAPIEKLRASILVDESDIDRVVSDARGQVATHAYPEQTFGMKVTRIVPLAEPKEGRNVFEVRGELDAHAPWMRPGMEGKAKIDAGRARVIWIATHKLVDFLRLKLWI